MTYTCSGCGKSCQANGVPSWWIWTSGLIFCSMGCYRRWKNGRSHWAVLDDRR